MSHLATERLRLQSAPDGLALVQDLVNTRDIGNKVPDLLATVDLARTWLAEALDDRPDHGSDSGGINELTERDLMSLRGLRTDLHNMLARNETDSRPTTVATVRLSRHPSGELRLEPDGSGVRRFASMIWGEVFLAQRADTWKRLKLCHKTACSSAFFDRSKNNSGVWHDVKMCGNAANLRASRARRRERDVASMPAAGGS